MTTQSAKTAKTATCATMTTETKYPQALADALEYADEDLAWLARAAAPWAQVACEVAEFGLVLESASMAKFATTMVAFVASMGPLLQALAAWRAVPTLDMGKKVLAAARPAFKAWQKMDAAKPDDFDANAADPALGSKRHARLQKAFGKLDDLDGESTLAAHVRGDEAADWCGPGTCACSDPDAYLDDEDDDEADEED